MDLGVIGLEGSDSGFSCISSYSETKRKLYGSDGFLKEGKSCSVDEEWWDSKMAKTANLSAFKEMERSPWTRSDDQKQEQMLIFASPKPDSSLEDKSFPNDALPNLLHKSSALGRNGVYGCGSFNHGVSSGALTGLRGPFTQSQWMELEHQALIYKYMTSDIPVPSHLLLPIKKALHSAAFSCFSGGFLKPSSCFILLFFLGEVRICWILSNPEKAKAGDKPGGGLGLSMESPTADVKSEATPFFIEKQQISFEESERSGFGVVSSESLLSPCLEDSHHSFCQFTNPTKNHCNRTAISWPDLEFESEITQATMSSAFPANDKLDSTRIDLEIGRVWETSIGGPLGEVLHQTNNNGGADEWDDGSPPRYGSSPTGVLQKSVFSSLSNRSGGNSSRADNAEAET